MQEHLAFAAQANGQSETGGPQTLPDPCHNANTAAPQETGIASDRGVIEQVAKQDSIDRQNVVISITVDASGSGALTTAAAAPEGHVNKVHTLAGCILYMDIASF